MPGSLTFVQTRYQPNSVAAPARLTQQCAYIGRAPLFGSQLEDYTVTSARGLLAAHGLAPAWGGPVAYHRMVLSLPSDGALAHQVMMRSLCTVALGDLSQILDRRLVWCASVHTDTENLHAHILIAGGDRRARSVTIRPAGLAAFKALVERHARLLS